MLHFFGRNTPENTWDRRLAFAHWFLHKYGSGRSMVSVDEVGIQYCSNSSRVYDKSLSDKFCHIIHTGGLPPHPVFKLLTCTN